MDNYPEHDNDSELDSREELFAALAKRMDDETYLHVRDHFDAHVAKGSVEKGYTCLTLHLLEYIGHVQTDLHQIYKIMTGDSLNSDPNKED